MPSPHPPNGGDLVDLVDTDDDDDDDDWMNDDNEHNEPSSNAPIIDEKSNANANPNGNDVVVANNASVSASASANGDNNDHQQQQQEQEQGQQQVITTSSTSTTLPQNNCNCNTCGSTEDCEEDVDNPGCYYCKSCWEKFDSTQEQQQQEQQQQQQSQSQSQSQSQDLIAGGGEEDAISPVDPTDLCKKFNAPADTNTTNNNNGGLSNSTSTSALMTPRDLSLNTQPETEASLTGASSQVLPQSQIMTQGEIFWASQQESIQEEVEVDVDGDEEEKEGGGDGEPTLHGDGTTTDVDFGKKPGDGETTNIEEKREEDEENPTEQVVVAEDGNNDDVVDLSKSLALGDDGKIRGEDKEEEEVGGGEENPIITEKKMEDGNAAADLEGSKEADGITAIAKNGEIRDAGDGSVREEDTKKITIDDYSKGANIVKNGIDANHREETNAANADDITIAKATTDLDLGEEKKKSKSLSVGHYGEINIEELTKGVNYYESHNGTEEEEEVVNNHGNDVVDSKGGERVDGTAASSDGEEGDVSDDSVHDGEIEKVTGHDSEGANSVVKNGIDANRGEETNADDDDEFIAKLLAGEDKSPKGTSSLLEDDIPPDGPKEGEGQGTGQEMEIDSSLLGEENNINISIGASPEDVRPDDVEMGLDNPKESEEEGQDTGNEAEVDEIEKGMEIDEIMAKGDNDPAIENENGNPSFDYDEEGTSVCTQEDLGESRENDLAMLLTQAVDSDDDNNDHDDGNASESDDDDLFSTEEDNDGGEEVVENNNGEVGMASKIIKAVEQQKEQTIIESVTANHDRNMNLSGLTEPTQSEHLLLRNEDGEAGTPSQRDKKSPNASTSKSLSKLDDEVSTALLPSDLGVNGKDIDKSCNNHVAANEGSSAYHGLTEEEEDEGKECNGDQQSSSPKSTESTVNSVDTGEATEKEPPQPEDEEEQLADHSGPKIDSANGNEVLQEGDNEFVAGQNASPDVLKPSENGDAKDLYSDNHPQGDILAASISAPQAKSQGEDQAKEEGEDKEMAIGGDNDVLELAGNTVEAKDVSSQKEQSLDAEMAAASESADPAKAKPQSEAKPDSGKTASEEDTANKMDIDDAEVLEQSAKQEGAGIARDHENTANEKHDENSGPHVGGQSQEEDEDVEGTEDTQVTTGSSSAGWSLYGGDTQMLPTGPSQILAEQEGVPATESLPKDVENQVVNEKAATRDVDKAVNEEAGNNLPMAESMENDASKIGIQKSNKPLVEEGMKEPADSEMNQERIIEENEQQINHQENIASLDNMKHTPENGSLPISYPNDHLASPAKKQIPCKKVSIQCKNMEKEGSDDDVGDDEEGTQMSEVLLSVSPARSSKDGLSAKSLGHAKSVLRNDGNVSKDPLAQPEANSSLKNNNGKVFEENNEDNQFRNNKVAEKGKLATPKSPPPRQKKTAIDETKWLSSSRHVHGKKQDATNNSNNRDGSSPRLLVPSFEPTHKNLYNKAATSLGDRAAADDDSDNEPWPGNGQNYEKSDSIKDTQEDGNEVKRPSAFKRLSRGSSSRSSMVNHDDDSSSTPHRSNEQHAKSSVSNRAKKVIKPKVLRYEAVTAKPDDDLSSSSSVASDSSSEVEFMEDYANDAIKFQQSQTDQRIMKQLEEVEGMASQLPSARELEEMASQKQLMEEIAELKKRHKSEITKLKRENGRLAKQLKTAKDAVTQKDRLIEQKDQALKNKSKLLEKQYEVIEKFKEQAQGLANGKSSSTSSTKHTPPTAATSKKRKKKNVEQLTRAIDGERTPPPVGKGSKRKKNAEILVGSDTSDSNDDSDDEVPISALKSKKKKGRKCYGSRGQANVPTSTKKAERGLSPNRKISSVASSSNNRSSGGDSTTSSVETSPMSNQTSVGAKRQKKQHQHKDSNSKNDTVRALSSELWKKLQERGWTYRTGPKPHNKVYVPNDGATHPGTQLGIHFFDCNQVVKAAMERGDLVEESRGVSKSKTPTSSPAARRSGRNKLPTNNDEGSDPEWDPDHELSESSPPALDDSKLCSKMKLLTLESARASINLAADFVRGEYHDRFVSVLFSPLWDRLKDQGSSSADATDSILNWRYEPYRDALSDRSWCFVPPPGCSMGAAKGNKGVLGNDYFLSEEQVVLCVLEEVSAMTEPEISRLYDDHAESFEEMLPVLTRAVDENMKYKDAKLGKSSSVRSRRKKSSFSSGQDSSSKPGAEEKNSQKKGESSMSKKRASKITPECSTKKQKQKSVEQPERHVSPSFHMSQTQSVKAILPSFNRRSPGKNQGPLSGYSFFYSGIDNPKMIDEKIMRLGGKVVPHHSLNLRNAHKRAFFLGDYKGWRKMKYIYATCLGVPMLQYQWLEELEKSGKAKVFDSELYIKYRLPLGLDLTKGFYPLQRASNARSWDPPGMVKGEGNVVFNGMTIALALDQAQENDWKMILTECGAVVKTLSDIQKGRGRITVDCCLFAATSLPPHVVSEPVHVSKLMKFIGGDVPLLDLAWAHQSLIQRKCVPMNGDDRYSVSLGHSMSSTCNVFSIKSSKTGIRYEVGDLVQFSRGPKTTSRGRIVDIIWERQGKGCKVEIMLLDSNGGYDLVDCRSSARIVVDESSLQGNILMLGTKDFPKVGYLPKNAGQSDIFNQFIPKNESQM